MAIHTIIKRYYGWRLHSLLLAVFCLNLAVPSVWAASVDDIRLWRAPDHTRLVFDVSDAVTYNLFVLENPHRVVIDINDSRLVGDTDNLGLKDSPITRVRSAIRDDNSLRVVLDLAHEVRPSSFILPPNSELGDRLVVDLYDESAPANRLSTVAPEASSSRADFSQTRNSGPIEAPAADLKRDIVVAIAAGHGGEDPGGIGYDGKLKEKNITLAISREIYAFFEKMPGYKPIMIRDGDYYVQLKRRPQIARDNRADIFLAIHADWYRNSSARGVTIYALSGDRADRENSRRISEKANGSDLLGGVGGDLDLEGWDDDVAMTLVSLQMAWSLEQSEIAGSEILKTLDGVARLRKDKVQQASLQVLNSPDIPSLLIETGYLTNPEEARRLASKSYQRQIAAGISQGVMNYFYQTPPDGSLIAWQKLNGISPSTYTVSSGDSLSLIAQRFGSTVNQLKSLNGLNADTIHIGQTLKLPGASFPAAGATEHTITRGETLSGIAARYRVSLASLRLANDIRGDRIMIGQKLTIPAS